MIDTDKIVKVIDTVLKDIKPLGKSRVEKDSFLGLFAIHGDKLEELVYLKKELLK